MLRQYGTSGWTGVLERRGCVPVSEEQRQAVEGDFERARMLHDARDMYRRAEAWTGAAKIAEQLAEQPEEERARELAEAAELYAAYEKECAELGIEIKKRKESKAKKAKAEAEEQDDTDYEIEALLKEFKGRKKKEMSYFLVRWVGYPAEGYHDTEEPESGLPAELVMEFRAERAAKEAAAKQAAKEAAAAEAAAEAAAKAAKAKANEEARAARAARAAAWNGVVVG